MEEDSGDIKKMVDNPSLRNNDNDLLEQLSVFSVYMHGTKKTIINTDDDLKIEGEVLIKYLQKVYHLENE